MKLALVGVIALCLPLAACDKEQPAAAQAAGTRNIQHDSPGKDKGPNRLPAPKGPISATMRLYWPKAEALDGTWKLPPLKRAKR